MKRADRETLFTLPVDRPWTKAEDGWLLFKVEKYTAGELADRINRTPDDVKRRCAYLDLEPSCGVYSLKKACDETGYATSQLERAKQALGMVWRKNDEGRFAITPDQLKELTDFLRDER